MGKFGKTFGWLFILAIIGYVAYSVLTGSSASGSAIYVPATGEKAEVIKYPDCVDTDKGKNYDTPGEAYNIEDMEMKRDYCSTPMQLTEYFCNNAYPDRITIQCRCESGACR